MDTDIQGFPKKTPVSQKPKIFIIYSVIRKVKISTFNILAIGRLLWETLYVHIDCTYVGYNKGSKIDLQHEKLNQLFVNLCRHYNLIHEIDPLDLNKFRGWSQY